MTEFYDLTKYISRLFSYHQHHFSATQFKHTAGKTVLTFAPNNMKVLALFAIFATIAYVSGASAPQVIFDGPTYELKPIEDGIDDAEMATADDSTDLTPIRHRRVTCDVLSWQSKWLSINHSACAIRCLAQRRKGGRCENGVCVCRN